jgi:hypothetical protein
VSPLFAFPDLHEQTLRILQRFPDASVAANIALRESRLMSIVNPTATVAAVRDCFFGLGKGIAFPPVLPLFVTVAVKLTLEDRNAYCREFVDRILAAPEKAHGMTVVNCWYSWLFRFFEVCGTLLDTVFEFLFLLYRNTAQLRLILDVDEETHTWNDMLVGKSLLTTFDPGHPTFPVLTCQQTGYIIGQLFRFGECRFIDVIRLIKSDDEAVYTAMSIVRHIAELQGESVFDDVVPVFDDERDSNTLQLFLFEDALTSRLLSITKQVSEAAADADYDRLGADVDEITAGIGLILLENYVAV